jgi:tetratricopeptide (TPR) repeat protein
MRIYLWYPARVSSRSPLQFKDYVRLANDDFPPVGKLPAGADLSLPVALAKGLKRGQTGPLLESRVQAVRDAVASPGTFPVLVFGQGLYFESPLSNFILCEYLASHGYVVATAPLKGTRYRLVNLNAEDLETQIRDMEFVLALAKAMKSVDSEKIGVIGYDLGGMSGLTMAMRNPGVGAFLSLDAGILWGHPSELLNRHPSYRADAFRIPWMHMTQSRFIRTFRDEQRLASLLDQKIYGDTFLVHVPTVIHADFSSYAMLDLPNPVPGYWGVRNTDSQPLYEAICRKALAFFDGYLKGKAESRQELMQASGRTADADLRTNLKIEMKAGRPAPASGDELIHLLIEKGFPGAKPALDRALAEAPEEPLFQEAVLNWLGYHFLYWWGREEEAVEVFELNTRLFPRSANAFDSLGEAFQALGMPERAIASYEKVLELKPGNKDVEALIERLENRIREELK